MHFPCPHPYLPHRQRSQVFSEEKDYILGKRRDDKTDDKVYDTLIRRIDAGVRKGGSYIRGEIKGIREVLHLSQEIL